MRAFVEQATGKVLTLQIEPEMAGGYTYRLYDRDSNCDVAAILFKCQGTRTVLDVISLSVFDHRNGVTARNQHPGVGRLLMYLACQDSLLLGAESVRVDALPSAAPFYRRMGMHHVLEESPVLEPRRSDDGRRWELAWRNAFDNNFSSTLAGGPLEAGIRTVVSTIEGKTLAQWEERADQFFHSLPQWQERFDQPRCSIL